MMQRSFRRTIALFALLALMACASSLASASQFIDPEQAYKVTAELGRDSRITLLWRIADGCKLYRERISISIQGGDAELGQTVLPKGIGFVDPAGGEKMEIYHGELKVVVPVMKANGPFRLGVRYQGCADDGLCYPPMDKVFVVDPSTPGQLSIANPADADAAVAPPKPVPDPASAHERKDDLSLAKETLAGGSLWQVSLAFIAFGLLLSFTPCVLPMVPILSSIIVGEGSASRAKSFLLAVAYCLGMALVYTSLGVAAGLAGEGLAGALQKPWVLLMFSLLLVGLALSMFDVYQLQLPTSLQNRLNKSSGRFKGGRFVGVFMMGSFSALIVGPCVAAPLAGTLVYISQTKNVLIGGLALFSMATGMSVPLLLIGLSAGSLLPKAGAWMTGVKYVFGFLLIGVAIWMATPVLPVQAVLLAWGSLAIIAAVFSGVFCAMPEDAGIGTKFTRSLGILLLLMGVIELFGAASGATSPLMPLAAARSRLDGALPVAINRLAFKRIHSADELDKELRATSRPVMLDFYAEWCVACKELEQSTFSDPEVLKKLAGVTLLQVDVSDNTAADRALMKRYGLFGPPGIIFFDSSGKEAEGTRIVGFVESGYLLQNLARID
ncbi:MAG: protein-disulfide reductase DsbD [Chlorobiaceae bacterium]|nr:protein-disulfide reductase DsbD [Chlorobiaceae bacterium]